MLSNMLWGWRQNIHNSVIEDKQVIEKVQGNKVDFGTGPNEIK